MNQKKTEAIKETLVTVFTGFVITYPLNLGLLYIALEILEFSVLMTSIFTTAGLTLAALVRVFTIRMHYSKDD